MRPPSNFHHRKLSNKILCKRRPSLRDDLLLLHDGLSLMRNGLPSQPNVQAADASLFPTSFNFKYYPNNDTVVAAYKTDGKLWTLNSKSRLGGFRGKKTKMRWPLFAGKDRPVALFLTAARAIIIAPHCAVSFFFSGTSERIMFLSPFRDIIFDDRENLRLVPSAHDVPPGTVNPCDLLLTDPPGEPVDDAESSPPGCRVVAATSTHEGLFLLAEDGSLYLQTETRKSLLFKLLYPPPEFIRIAVDAWGRIAVLSSYFTPYLRPCSEITIYRRSGALVKKVVMPGLCIQGMTVSRNKLHPGLAFWDSDGNLFEMTPSYLSGDEGKILNLWVSGESLKIKNYVFCSRIHHRDAVTAVPEPDSTKTEAELEAEINSWLSL